MKTKLTFLLIISLLLFSKPTVADFQTEESKSEDIADLLKQSVVRIADDTTKGTGFYISDYEIITNSHVVTDGHYILTEDSKYTPCQAFLVKRDEKLDLALLKSKCKGTPLKPSQSVKTGQTILIMGNPSGLPFVLTKGIVSGVVGYFILHDAYSDHGSSGSPIVNVNGEYVGIVARGLKDTNNFGAGILEKAISEFLK